MLNLYIYRLGWSLFLKVKNIEVLLSQVVRLNKIKNMSPFEEFLEVAQWDGSFGYGRIRIQPRGPSCSSSASTECSLAGYSTKYSVKRNMSM